MSQMTNQQFEGFLDFCLAELKMKQEKLKKFYEISNYKTFRFLYNDKIIKFENESQNLDFIIIPVGIWNLKESHWTWGWSLDALLPMSLQRDADGLKELGTFTGISLFSAPSFHCEPEIVEELLAFSVFQLDAIGVHHIVLLEKYNLYLALLHTVKIPEELET